MISNVGIVAGYSNHFNEEKRCKMFEDCSCIDSLLASHQRCFRYGQVKL